VYLRNLMLGLFLWLSVGGAALATPVQDVD
jgi:hypothetical protein